jgi:hypothetical protein
MTRYVGASDQNLARSGKRDRRWAAAQHDLPISGQLYTFGISLHVDVPRRPIAARSDYSNHNRLCGISAFEEQSNFSPDILLAQSTYQSGRNGIVSGVPWEIYQRATIGLETCEYADHDTAQPERRPDIVSRQLQFGYVSHNGPPRLGMRLLDKLSLSNVLFFRGILKPNHLRCLPSTSHEFLTIKS